MTDLPEFKPWKPIPRLARDCVITEKIDGTNGIVWVSEDKERVLAGSRNRWLTLDHDNHGFCRWVTDHAEELKRLGPGYHYGEWWGSGIQRRYGLDHKRFSLFNVGRWGEGGPCEPPPCCYTVPVLYRGRFDSAAIDRVMETLEVHGSFAAPGFMDPEGIVVYHCRANQLFKLTRHGDAEKAVSAA